MRERPEPAYGSLLKDLPSAAAGEVLDPLWRGLIGEAAGNVGPEVEIERIVSRGQASPPAFWYDQAHLEVVLVVRGAARLAFESRSQEVSLAPGDYCVIPAHCRHRVAWTSPDEDTIWFAVHVGKAEA